MREEREREEREIFPDGWFSSNSLILFRGRKSTFEKREKKYKKKILRAANAQRANDDAPGIERRKKMHFSSSLSLCSMSILWGVR